MGKIGPEISTENKTKFELRKIDSSELPFVLFPSSFIMKIQEFIRPKSIEEVTEFVATNSGSGAIIAGGTDLLLEHDRVLDYVIDLTALDLRYIRQNADSLSIGAATPIHDLEKAAETKIFADGMLAECAAHFAGLQIRNMATIGGNIVNAIPSADVPPPFLALDAQVRIFGKEERVIPLRDFFLDVRETVLGDDLLVEVIVPIPPENARGRFLKVARTPGDIATVNVATLLQEKDGKCENVRIALGAVYPTPLRAVKAEEFLIGNDLSMTSIEKAAQIVGDEVKPISDHRASAAYRKQMSILLTKRALMSSIEI